MTRHCTPPLHGPAGPAGTALRRRQLLQWPAALALAAHGHDAPAQPRPPAMAELAEARPGGGARLALLIGNSDYPVPNDLPSIGKNVADLDAALKQRGFEVEAHVNLDQSNARRHTEAFARRAAAAGDDALLFFYFSGHGVQIDAENLLVGAGANPAARADGLRKTSLMLGPDVVTRLPRPARGQLIAVVDACRTSLKAMVEGEGMNQVEAPPNCMIVFSTAAGKPALAPAVPTLNTFFTGALVKQIEQASDQITFSDLMRLAKYDTQRTMENHPAALIRRFAQHPFIAENTPVPVLLAQPTAMLQAPSDVPAGASRPQAADTTPENRQRFGSTAEAGDWGRLQATLWPPDVLRRADDFLRRYPDSKLAGGALVAREGAADAARLLTNGDIKLFRRSFAPIDKIDKDDESYRADLTRAARGDKDAAARIGRRWQTAATSGPEPTRYEGWMEYAAQLGNGIASYELALHYRRLDQPLAAARWDALSRELGYTPPPSLDNRRK